MLGLSRNASWFCFQGLCGKKPTRVANANLVITCTRSNSLCGVPSFYACLGTLPCAASFRWPLRCV